MHQNLSHKPNIGIKTLTFGFSIDIAYKKDEKSVSLRNLRYSDNAIRTVSVSVFFMRRQISSLVGHCSSLFRTSEMFKTRAPSSQCTEFMMFLMSSAEFGKDKS